MKLATQIELQESPWTQLEKADAVNRQRRAADVVQGFFNDSIEIDKVTASLDHLRNTNGRGLDDKFLPLELRTSIIDAALAAEYLATESLFTRKYEAFLHSHKRAAKPSCDGKSADKMGLSKEEELKISHLAPDFEAWCALPKSEKEHRHNSAEETLLKFFILSCHIQDDTSLFRGSLGIDGYSEQATRLTIESQLQNWLRLDSHEKITAGHTTLMESLGTVVNNFIEDPRGFPLDIKLWMIDLFFAMKSAQSTFENLAQPADLSRFRETMRKAEVAGEKYLLAEQIP